MYKSQQKISTSTNIHHSHLSFNRNTKSQNNPGNEYKPKIKDIAFIHNEEYD